MVCPVAVLDETLAVLERLGALVKLAMERNFSTLVQRNSKVVIKTYLSKTVNNERQRSRKDRRRRRPTAAKVDSQPIDALPLDIWQRRLEMIFGFE